MFYQLEPLWNAVNGISAKQKLPVVGQKRMLWRSGGDEYLKMWKVFQFIRKQNTVK